MEKGSISNYFVNSALAPVIARGLDAQSLLRDAGIPLSVLVNAQGRVKSQNFAALWLGVARQLDDELFGQDSHRMKVGSFAFLCQTLVHCKTLHGALLQMVRFFNLLLDDFYCSVEVIGENACLSICERPCELPPRVFGHETLLIMQHGIACWLSGRRIPILTAEFAYKEPVYSEEYRAMYSENLRFDATRTTLIFNKSFLELPVIQSERHARDFVRGAPANFILKYKNSTGLAARIRRHLRAALCSNWPDFDSLAASLRMSPSTLRRRLDEEGQSFQAIKDDLRRDMAVDFLCNSNKSVTDISVEMGFTEVSAFHRAFKKWTGQKPSEYSLASLRQI